MAPICGVCHGEESKYKCPVCERRYCSIACYKTHKAIHEEQGPANDSNTEQSQTIKRDRPGTTQRIRKVDFTGFENDQDFQRLLSRYPLLKVQLQTVYGLTLEPGPEDARSWNRQPLPGSAPPEFYSNRGNRGRARGRGDRGHRGGRGVRGRVDNMPEDRQRGPWTKEKGDKEALTVINKMRQPSGEGDEASEGIDEFVQLCRIKFGADREGDSDAKAIA